MCAAAWPFVWRIPGPTSHARIKFRADDDLVLAAEVLPRVQMRAELMATIEAMRAEVQGSGAAAAAAHSNGTDAAAAAHVTEETVVSHAPIGPAARPDTATGVEPASGTGTGADADATTAEPSAKRRRLLDARPGNKNAKMHPRSLYAQHEPDFAALAAKYRGLAEFTTMRPDGRSRVLLVYRSPWFRPQGGSQSRKTPCRFSSTDTLTLVLLQAKLQFPPKPRPGPVPAPLYHWLSMHGSAADSHALPAARRWTSLSLRLCGS